MADYNPLALSHHLLFAFSISFTFERSPCISYFHQSLFNYCTSLAFFCVVLEHELW